MIPVSEVLQNREFRHFITFYDRVAAENVAISIMYPGRNRAYIMDHELEHVQNIVDEEIDRKLDSFMAMDLEMV